jgi:peptide chain release factor 1
MEGRIDEVITALQKADYDEKLAALTGQTYAPPRAVAED